MQKLLGKFDIKLKAFRITNIIANGNLGYEVNLTKIAELPTAFKDDKSSGVFIRMEKVKCIVIFKSGKIILNGSTKM